MMGLWLIILISFPVFYIVGIAVFIKWIIQNGQPRPISEATKAAVKIRAYADKQSSGIARELNDLADELEGLPHATRVEPDRPGHKSHVVPHSVPAHIISDVPMETRSADWMRTDISDLTRNLDNINLILYLGAFLVVISAGIFVGYNFSVLSGVFKTVFLALFAAAFYCVGLVLFLKSRKLRPAGTTFTGIGLVLIPLVGLAAYNFTSLHNHGSITWFLTSMFTLAAYIATLAATRQAYIAYLMAFTALSTFESSVSLFNLPIYWFGWAMSLCSIALFAVGGTRLIQLDETRAALTISANIFVPASLLMSVFSIAPSGLGQLGVTFGIAGAFYAAMARRFVGHRSDAENYWVVALISPPLALGTGLWDSLSRTGIALVMLGVSAAYLSADFIFETKLSRRWRELMAAVTGLAPLSGIVMLYDHPKAITAILVAVVLINGTLALRLRNSALAFLAVLAFLALPFELLRQFIDPAWPWSGVATLLLLEVPVLVWWVRRMRGWPESGEVTGIAGYLLALMLALIAAALSSETALLLVGLAVAAILYGLSRYEQHAEFIYGAAAGLYIAIFQIPSIGHWETATVSLLFLASGVALYGLASAETDPDRAQALRYSGLVGPFIGAFVGFGQESRLEPAVSLATGGGLVVAEGLRTSESTVQEIGGGIILLSFNWLLKVMDVSQLQAYTIPWALYVGYLGYRRREQGHEAYDSFTVISLALLTVPLAGQALASN
ncbi:MAG TPA: hypothetical protein VHQ86_05555, partial [Candidatus Saccharimonadia bacterium]|nr:hypothetical protein [Candidatus Saccharimonadia bacterium]